MSGNFRKEDLRVIKTYKALISAILTLLERRGFAQITVNDLCEEAQISRATFYSHFNDKYDLLKYWLNCFKEDLLKEVYDYEQLERAVNGFIRENSKILTNLLQNANNEILEMLYDFMESFINSAISNKKDPDKSNAMILAKFCSGGMVNLLEWQIRNKYSVDFEYMNRYFYDLVICILEWNEEQ